jgi:hypothetical protein
MEGMRLRPLRTWWWVAVVVAVVALSAAGGMGPAPLHVTDRGVAGVSSDAPAGSALEAVLRAESDRAESAVTGKSGAIARLIVLLAAALVGIALLLVLAARRRALAVPGVPPLARRRVRVGLRAPPSSLLVQLQH